MPFDSETDCLQWIQRWIQKGIAGEFCLSSCLSLSVGNNQSHFTDCRRLYLSLHPLFISWIHNHSVIDDFVWQTVYMKMRNPTVTAGIRSSGKITLIGCTSEADCKKAARRVARCLQKLGFKVRISGFRIVNVLGNVNFPFGIKLVPFTENHPKVCRWVFCVSECHRVF